MTAKSRALPAAVIALMQWGDKWEADAAGPPVEVVHRDCGHPVDGTGLARQGTDYVLATSHQIVYYKD